MKWICKLINTTLILILTLSPCVPPQVATEVDLPKETLAPLSGLHHLQPVENGSLIEFAKNLHQFQSLPTEESLKELKTSLEEHHPFVFKVNTRFYTSAGGKGLSYENGKFLGIDLEENPLLEAHLKEFSGRAWIEYYTAKDTEVLLLKDTEYLDKNGESIKLKKGERALLPKGTWISGTRKDRVYKDHEEKILWEEKLKKEFSEGVKQLDLNGDGTLLKKLMAKIKNERNAGDNSGVVLDFQAYGGMKLGYHAPIKVGNKTKLVKKRVDLGVVTRKAEKDEEPAGYDVRAVYEEQEGVGRIYYYLYKAEGVIQKAVEVSEEGEILESRVIGDGELIYYHDYILHRNQKEKEINDEIETMFGLMLSSVKDSDGLKDLKGFFLWARDELDKNGFNDTPIQITLKGRKGAFYKAEGSLLTFKSRFPPQEGVEPFPLRVKLEFEESNGKGESGEKEILGINILKVIALHDVNLITIFNDVLEPKKGDTIASKLFVQYKDEEHQKEGKKQTNNFASLDDARFRAYELNRIAHLLRKGEIKRAKELMKQASVWLPQYEKNSQEYIFTFAMRALLGDLFNRKLKSLQTLETIRQLNINDPTSRALQLIPNYPINDQTIPVEHIDTNPFLDVYSSPRADSQQINVDIAWEDLHKKTGSLQEGVQVVLCPSFDHFGLVKDPDTEIYSVVMALWNMKRSLDPSTKGAIVLGTRGEFSEENADYLRKYFGLNTIEVIRNQMEFSRGNLEISLSPQQVQMLNDKVNNVSGLVLTDSKPITELEVFKKFAKRRSNRKLSSDELIEAYLKSIRAKTAKYFLPSKPANGTNIQPEDILDNVLIVESIKRKERQEEDRIFKGDLTSLDFDHIFKGLEVFPGNKLREKDRIERKGLWAFPSANAKSTDKSNTPSTAPNSSTKEKPRDPLKSQILNVDYLPYHLAIEADPLYSPEEVIKRIKAVIKVLEKVIGNLIGKAKENPELERSLQYALHQSKLYKQLYTELKHNKQANSRILNYILGIDGPEDTTTEEDLDKEEFNFDTIDILKDGFQTIGMKMFIRMLKFKSQLMVLQADEGDEKGAMLREMMKQAMSYKNTMVVVTGKTQRALDSLIFELGFYMKGENLFDIYRVSSHGFTGSPEDVIDLKILNEVGIKSIIANQDLPDNGGKNCVIACPIKLLNSKVMKKAHFDVLIVNEANMMNEVELVTAASRALSLVLVRDPFQSGSFIDTEKTLNQLKINPLSTSPFLSNPVKIITQRFDSILLSNITRFSEPIMKVINGFFNNYLQSWQINRISVMPDLVVKPTNRKEEFLDVLSERKSIVTEENIINRQEIDRTMAQIEEWLSMGISLSHIVVLSAYSSQVEAIAQQLKMKDIEISLQPNNNGIRVTTIDEYNEHFDPYIIISFVRSNDRKEIGPWRNPFRIVKAITRARSLEARGQLVLLFNPDTFLGQIMIPNGKTKGKDLFQVIIEEAKKEEERVALIRAIEEAEKEKERVAQLPSFEEVAEKEDERTTQTPPTEINTDELNLNDQDIINVSKALAQFKMIANKINKALRSHKEIEREDAETLRDLVIYLLKERKSNKKDQKLIDSILYQNILIFNPSFTLIYNYEEDSSLINELDEIIIIEWDKNKQILMKESIWKHKEDSVEAILSYLDNNKSNIDIPTLHQLMEKGHFYKKGTQDTSFLFREIFPRKYRLKFEPHMNHIRSALVYHSDSNLGQITNIGAALKDIRGGIGLFQDLDPVILTWSEYLMTENRWGHLVNKLTSRLPKGKSIPNKESLYLLKRDVDWINENNDLLERVGLSKYHLTVVLSDRILRYLTILFGVNEYFDSNKYFESMIIFPSELRNLELTKFLSPHADLITVYILKAGIFDSIINDLSIDKELMDWWRNQSWEYLAKADAENTRDRLSQILSDHTLNKEELKRILLESKRFLIFDMAEKGTFKEVLDQHRELIDKWIGSLDNKEDIDQLNIILSALRGNNTEKEEVTPDEKIEEDKKEIKRLVQVVIEEFMSEADHLHEIIKSNSSISNELTSSFKKLIKELLILREDPKKREDIDQTIYKYTHIFNPFYHLTYQENEDTVILSEINQIVVDWLDERLEGMSSRFKNMGLDWIQAIETMIKRFEDPAPVTQKEFIELITRCIKSTPTSQSMKNADNQMLNFSGFLREEYLPRKFRNRLEPYIDTIRRLMVYSDINDVELLASIDEQLALLRGGVHLFEDLSPVILSWKGRNSAITQDWIKLHKYSGKKFGDKKRNFNDLFNKHLALIEKNKDDSSSYNDSGYDPLFNLINGLIRYYSSHDDMDKVVHIKLNKNKELIEKLLSIRPNFYIYYLYLKMLYPGKEKDHYKAWWKEVAWNHFVKKDAENSRDALAELLSDPFITDEENKQLVLVLNKYLPHNDDKIAREALTELITSPVIDEERIKKSLLDLNKFLPYLSEEFEFFRNVIEKHIEIIREVLFNETNERNLVDLDKIVSRLRGIKGMSIFTPSLTSAEMEHFNRYLDINWDSFDSLMSDGVQTTTIINFINDFIQNTSELFKIPYERHDLNELEIQFLPKDQYKFHHLAKKYFLHLVAIYSIKFFKDLKGKQEVENSLSAIEEYFQRSQPQINRISYLLGHFGAGFNLNLTPDINEADNRKRVIEAWRILNEVPSGTAKPHPAIRRVLMKRLHDAFEEERFDDEDWMNEHLEALIDFSGLWDYDKDEVVAFLKERKEKLLQYFKITKSPRIFIILNEIANITNDSFQVEKDFDVNDALSTFNRSAMIATQFIDKHNDIDAISALPFKESVEFLLILREVNKENRDLYDKALYSQLSLYSMVYTAFYDSKDEAIIKKLDEIILTQWDKEDPSRAEKIHVNQLRGPLDAILKILEEGDIPLTYDDLLSESIKYSNISNQIINDHNKTLANEIFPRLYRHRIEPHMNRIRVLLAYHLPEPYDYKTHLKIETMILHARGYIGIFDELTPMPIHNIYIKHPFLKEWGDLIKSTRRKPNGLKSKLNKAIGK